MANKTVWRGDGTTFTVYSDDEPVLQTPFTVLTATPDTLVGQDPATGRPAYCPSPALTPGPPGPPGPTGDTGPPGTAAAPTDDEMICGMARFLARQHYYGYAWVRDQILTALSMWQHDASLDTSVLFSILSFYLPVASGYTSLLTNLITGMTGTDVALEQASLPALTPGQVEDGVVQSWFCGIKNSTGTGAVTTDTLALVKALIDSYGNWINMPDGTSAQPVILKAVIDQLPVATWAKWALRGKADPSKSCADMDCVLDTGWGGGGSWT